jgi:hypothetical protein
MCTAVIVASLPGLKKLIMRKSTPGNTSYDRDNSGYMQTGSGHVSGRGGVSKAECTAGQMEDEVELVFLDRKPSKSSHGSDRKIYAKDGVSVTKDITVTHDIL